MTLSWRVAGRLLSERDSRAAARLIELKADKLTGYAPVSALDYIGAQLWQTWGSKYRHRSRSKNIAEHCFIASGSESAPTSIPAKPPRLPIPES